MHWLRQCLVVLTSRKIYFLLSVFLSVPLYAQHGLLGNYFVERWTSINGLPHNSINAITQTEDGYLWFATWEGVVRYNGLEFKLFDRNSQTHMLDSGTRTLVAGADNTLWVGGSRGSISRRLGFTWQPQSQAPGLVNHILIDHHQNQWLAIEGLGVIFRPFISDGQYGNSEWLLQNVSTYHLAKNALGNIFAATEKGLYQFDAKQPQHIPSNHFQRLYHVSIASNGDVLLGANRGAWRWDGNTLHSLSTALQKTAITLVEEDNKQRLWFGTITQGIARLSEGKLEFLDARKGLPDNQVLSWYQDIEGSIWIGTNSGMVRLRDTPFVSITKEKGLIGNYVRTILAINERHILVGSSSGLSLLDKHGTRAATDSPYSLSVLSLALAKNGGAWVGTHQHGLFHWWNGQLTSVFNENKGLKHNEIRTILEDSRGNLWIGTPAGLTLRTAQGELQHFNKENNGLIDNYVMALTEDEQGNIWYGTGFGAGFWSDGKLVNIALEQLEQTHYVFGFYTEPGYVWMTTDRGLIRYRHSDQSTILIGRSQGVPIDKFFQILRDEAFFWLSSNRGIWKISYSQAHRVADGIDEQIEVEHLSERDGMSSSQANGGSNPAAIRTPDGHLYFATTKGVAIIHPNSLSRWHKNPIPIVLESIKFDEKRVDSVDNIIVPAGISRLAFSYAGLSYVMSTRLQYRTKLEGFDTDWSYRANTTHAEYTNLPPGEYRFFVSARYPYEEWHDSDVLYEFHVEPKFWQRSEVVFLCLFILLALTSIGVRWRINQLKKSESYLKEQVAQQTQALRTQAEKFEQLSKEDALTGLANRRAFDIYLQQSFIKAKQQQQVLNVAILDIDHFKHINDRYSHLIGDQAIIAIAQILSDYVGDKTLLSRWGGEEFTLLYFGDPNHAYCYFDQLREKIAQTDFSLVTEGLALTVSIGMAGDEEITHYGEILKLADQALLTAKRNGRNRIERGTRDNL